MANHTCTVNAPAGSMMDTIAGLLGRGQTVDFSDRTDIFEAELSAARSAVGTDSQSVRRSMVRPRSAAGLITYTRRAAVAYHHVDRLGARLSTRI
ncbi:MAG: hypothetical protein VX589_17105 [Myxococcota bacterium]|nr:hypothetical protein [Myxococcota bacterium]